MNIKDYGWDEYFEQEWKKGIASEMSCAISVTRGVVPVMPGEFSRTSSMISEMPDVTSRVPCLDRGIPVTVPGNTCSCFVQPGRIIADYGQMLRIASEPASEQPWYHKTPLIFSVCDLTIFIIFLYK